MTSHSDLRKAAEMAATDLEELIHWHGVRNSDDKLMPAHNQTPEIKSAIEGLEALRQALAQPEQEPVGWMWERRYDNGDYSRHLFYCEYDAREHAKDGVGLPNPDIVLPVYTAPPKREWQRLTGDDKHFLLANAWNKEQAFDGFMDAIDKFLEEKNT